MKATRVTYFLSDSQIVRTVIYPGVILTRTQALRRILEDLTRDNQAGPIYIREIRHYGEDEHAPDEKSED